MNIPACVLHCFGQLKEIVELYATFISCNLWSDPNLHFKLRCSEMWNEFVLFCPQVATLSSQMQEWRTVPSSSATMDSATCAVTHVPRSCRSRARATSCTDLTPNGWPSPRWRRPCSGQRSGGWRLTFTTKMVGTETNLHACDSRVWVGVNLLSVCLLWSAGNTAIISLFTKKQPKTLVVIWRDMVWLALIWYFQYDYSNKFISMYFLW